ncbi:MAG: hypothetical protein AAGC68_07160, partial [Verrucomicrobiota bacterium]
MSRSRVGKNLRAWFLLAVSLLVQASTAEAQLFGGKGLFDRKEEPLRIQTQEEIGVPVPVQGRVEAIRGTEIQFELRAETKTPGASVEFLIRTFPSAGKILSLVSIPGARNRALVTYLGDPASTAESDAFAFAVRYRGGRYSAAMRYDIDFVGSTSSQIQILSERLDFGEVMIGNRESREVAVRNMSGTEFSRVLFLTPPWHIVKPKDGKLILGPRQSKVVEIEFRPDRVGETNTLLALSRSKGGTSTLSGSGTDPFDLLTKVVELEMDPLARERTGEVTLLNKGSKPIQVEARASSRLQHSIEEEYLLPPGKPWPVTVRLAETDVAPFDGMIQFFLENGYSKSAQVTSPVVPGSIEVEIPNSLNSEVINFGQVRAGRSTERGIRLTNRGGVALPLEFHIPEPFRLLTNPGPQLGARASVNLSIGLYPSSSQKGMIDSTMQIYGNEIVVPVRLLGNVIRGERDSAGSEAAAPGAISALKGMRLASPVSPEPEPLEEPSIGSQSLAPTGPSPGNSAVDVVSVGPNAEGASGLDGEDRFKLWYRNLSEEAIEKLRSPSGLVLLPIVGREWNHNIRRPEDLSVFEAGDDYLTIGWTAPRDSNLFTFEVELAGIQIDNSNGMPTNVWIPYEDVEFERIDRLVK